MLRLKSYYKEKAGIEKSVCCRPVTPKARTVMTTVLFPHVELPVNTLQVSVKTSWAASCKCCSLFNINVGFFSSVALQDSESNVQPTQHRRRNRSALSCVEKHQ